MALNYPSELEHAYNLLTNKLRKLNYNYPIGIESTQLVDKILTQLISTTEGYQKLSNKFNSLKTELDAEKKTCLPLRNENMKLVKENNELHLEMIKLREDFERKEISLTNAISKLDKEKQEMRYLITQKETHIKNIENDSEFLRKKLNEITEKVYGKNKKGIVNSNYNKMNKLLMNESNNPMNPIGKKQEIILSGGLEGSEFEFPNQVSKLFSEIKANKEEWANDIKAADERAIKFRADIKKAEETNKNLIAKIEFLEKQINYREQEIKRIGSSYSTSDNIEEIKMRYDTDTLRSQIDKLNSQIDFLNKENQKNEEIVKLHNNQCNIEELKKMEKNISQLKKDNEKLKKELVDLKNDNPNKNKTDGNTKNLNAQIRDLADCNNKNAGTVLEENLKIKKENLNINKQLEQTNNKLQDLQIENERLKQINNENNSYINTDRSALIKNLNMLKLEIQDLKKQIDESQNQYEQTNKQNESLKSELNLIKGKELLKNNDFESNPESRNKFFKEFSELANENKILRNKINELEEINLNFNKIHSKLSKENENFQKMNSALENKIGGLEDELSKHKYIQDNSMTSTQKLESQYAILDNKYQSLLSDNENLNNILEAKANLLKDAETKSEKYFNQIQICNETISNLQIEYKNLSKEFTDIMNKNKRLEDKVKSYEKDFNENKFIKEKLTDYEENAKNAKADKAIFEKENKVLRNELIKLNEEITSLKALAEENKNIIDILREDKKKLLKYLEDNSNNLLNLEEKLNNNSGISNHLEDLKTKNSDLSNKLISKISEIEKLNSELSIAEFEVKKKNNEIIRLKEILDSNKIESNAKIDEIKFLKEQIEKLKIEIIEKKISDNSTVSANLLELQEKYTQEKIKFDQANFSIKDLNEKFAKLSEEKDNLANKIANMTKLLAEADNTRAEMFSKIQQEINKSKFLENENIILKEKSEKNLAELLNLQDENKKLKTGISSLDQNYDLLNNEVDFKTEEISKLNLLVKNLQEANDELSKKLSVQLSKLSTESKRLADRESELKELRIINSRLQKENMEINTILQQKNIEFQHYNYEIKRLDDENSNLHEQILRMTKEMESLTLIKSQMEKNSEVIAQRYRSNELEFSELFNAFKEAEKENERLKKNLQIFINENKEAFNYIKQLENNLSNSMTTIQQNLIEKDSLLKKLEMMENFEHQQNEEIERLREKLENKISNEDKLKRNIELDQEINMNYENHTIQLQRKISELESEIRKYEETINNLNSRIEYLNHLNKKQEFDMNNLELILVDERKKLHNFDLHIQKLKDEKEKLKIENNQLMIKVSENSDLKNLKNKFSNDFIKNSNDDENNALKMLVHDLQNQLVSMQNDLKTVREENTRLLSERSIRENILSDRIFSASSPSNKSDSKAEN